MSTAKQRHDTLVQRIHDILQVRYDYDRQRLRTHVEKRNGEEDVSYEDRETHIYWEVKGRDTDEGYERALDQAFRFYQRADADKYTRCIYVSQSTRNAITAKRILPKEVGLDEYQG